MNTYSDLTSDIFVLRDTIHKEGWSAWAGMDTHDEDDPKSSSSSLDTYKGNSIMRGIGSRYLRCDSGDYDYQDVSAIFYPRKKVELNMYTDDCSGLRNVDIDSFTCPTGTFMRGYGLERFRVDDGDMDTYNHIIVCSDGREYSLSMQTQGYFVDKEVLECGHTLGMNGIQFNYYRHGNADWDMYDFSILCESLP